MIPTAKPRMPPAITPKGFNGQWLSSHHPAKAGRANSNPTLVTRVAQYIPWDVES